MHSVAWLGVALFVLGLIVAALVVVTTKCRPTLTVSPPPSPTPPSSAPHSRMRIHGSVSDPLLGTAGPGVRSENATRVYGAGDHGGGHKLRVIDRKYWVPDSAAAACTDCAAMFNFFRRRHHCRICGLVFCAKCSFARIPGDPFGRDEPLRVCSPCESAFRAARSSASLLPPRELVATFLPPSDHDDLARSSDHDASYASDDLVPNDATLSSSASADGLDTNIITNANDDNAPTLALTLPHERTVAARRVASLPPASIAARLHERQVRSRSSRADSQTRLIGMLSPHSSATFGPARALPLGPPPLPTARLPPVSDDASDDSESAASTASAATSTLATMALISARDVTARRDGADADADDDDDVWGSSLPAMGGGGPSAQLKKSPSLVGLHVGASGRADGDGEAGARVQALFADHLQVVVRANLVRLGLPSEWTEQVVQLGRDAAALVTPSIVDGDALDVRAYVTVEHVVGGTMDESRVVHGSVCFKRVAHKRMATSIAHPRILLVDGTIEHKRSGAVSALANFDTLLVQEAEMIRLAVAKVMDVAPQIVVVSGPVARLAREAFLDAGVTLIPSVGSDLCHRLARLTSATVLHSVDAIAANAAVLGTCGHFCAETLATPAGRKLMLVFDGTPAELGVTLLLRGAVPAGWLGSEPDFRAAVAEVVDVALLGAFHAVHECAQYRDEGVVFAPEFEAWLHAGAQSAAGVSAHALAARAREAAGLAPVSPTASPYATAFWRRVDLSLSPGVWLPPPYTEDHPEASHIGVRMARQGVEGGETLVEADGAANALSPLQFQSLCVLFSTSSVHHAMPCCIPHAQVLEFYQDSDMTLGQYLDVCFDLSNTCRQVHCQLDMLSHVCTYAHGTSSVVVRVDTLPAPLPGSPDPNTLFMWSCCKECSTVSAAAPVSDDTWRLSFGKYLETSLYPVPVVLADAACPHLVHLSHVRYFAKGELVLSFEHQPVAIFDLNPPAPELTFDASTQNRVLAVERTELLAAVSELDAGIDESALMLEIRACETRAALDSVRMRLVASEAADAAALGLAHHHVVADGDGAPHLIVDNEPTSVIRATLQSAAYADAVGAADAAAPHFEHTVASDGYTFHCKVFFAHPFADIRARYCGGDDAVLESLARCAGWAATGGKSDSEFVKTLDDRLILKEVQKVEMKSFVDVAPAYFEYMERVLGDDLPSLLIKFLGVFEVEILCKVSGVKYSKYVVLMENLFFQRSVDKVFDLKGSERSRYVKAAEEGQVLMDENFLEYIAQSPLYVREHSKLYLYSALCNDSLFLASLKVMDYSLLVGVDYATGDITVGIIDYIRQYTWDKRLECWVKRSGLLGGGGKQPTVISPHNYKDRFRRAMNRYFVVVPDKHAYV